MPIRPADHVALVQFVDEWNANHPSPSFNKNTQIKFSIGFKNHCKTVDLPDSLIFDMPNSAAIAAFMREISILNTSNDPDESITVHAAAGGLTQDNGEPVPFSASFSLSDIATAQVIIRATGDEFQQVTLLKEKPEFQPDAIAVIRAGANIQQGKLDRILYENFDLALATTPLIHTVTPAGGTGSGYHGTGHAPSVNGLTHAYTLCTFNGDIIRIDKTHPFFKTIRGGHLGLFGIVLSVEYECEKAYDLDYELIPMNFHEFRAAILDKGLFRKDDFTHAYMIPLYEHGEAVAQQKNIVVYRGNKVPKDVSLHTHNRIGPSAGVQSLLNKVSDLFSLGALLDRVPALIPYFNKYCVAEIEVGEHITRVRGPSWQLQHYLEGGYPTKILDTSFLYPASEDRHEITDIIGQIYHFMNKAFAEFQEGALTRAIFIRNIDGEQETVAGEHGLSTSVRGAKQNIVAVDVVTDNQNRAFIPFRDNYSQWSIEHQGKAHWGKYIPPNYNVPAVFGQGLTHFVAALLYIQLEQRLSKTTLLNILDGGPESDDWKSAVESLAFNPFITPAFDQLLKLNKYSAQYYENSRLTLQRAERRHQALVRIDQYLDSFTQALIKHDADHRTKASGEALASAAQTMRNSAISALRDNVENPLRLLAPSRARGDISPADAPAEQKKGICSSRCVIL